MAKTKEKESKTYRPSDLAEELDVSAKQVRAFLRSEFPRELEAKNSSWILSEKMASRVRERFSPKADEE